MRRTGTVTLPLHYGRAPRWLFERMRALARAIVELIVMEFGPEAFIKRISDPNWFQALGCLLGFDWHSSGLTTTTAGAIKDAIRGIEEELNIFIAGGKGKTSRKTPEEIMRVADRIGFDPSPLVYASRMSAKVDSAALQDGYEIYHHTFFFTPKGVWAVVQQGMNTGKRYARRYHWLSEELDSFVVEPHKGIWSVKRGNALNLVAKESLETQRVMTELASSDPFKIKAELEKMKEMKLPDRHKLLLKDINPSRISKILLTTYERKPENFEELLGTEGLGPKTLRALALISDVVYGAPPSYEDPFVYSYAHGGKDGTPYPVNRRVYDKSVEVLEKAIKLAKIGRREKVEALRRLSSLFET
jgi:hypothetical protein